MAAANARSMSIAALLVTWWMLAGCSEDLPYAPPVEVPYTLFGVVNPLADTQAVIVYPITSGSLQPIGPEPLDAVVRSTDLATGEERVWRDSVVSDGERGFSHIFWSDFQAAFGHEYRLDVVRSDGEASSVSVHVPRHVLIEENDDGRSRMTVAFRAGTFRLVRLDVTYSVGFAFGPSRQCPRMPNPFHYTLSHAREEIRQANGWDLVFDLEQYVPLITNFLFEDAGTMEVPAGFRPGLAALTLDVTIGDELWRLPPGFLDRRILSHPGTLTNAENGLGFVGAGYKIERRLFPSTAAIEDAGFYDYLEGRPGCE